MSACVEPKAYSRDNPFTARVMENRLLSGPGSEKETRHIVVRIAGSGMTFKPGDSLGVLPLNHPVLVQSIIDALGARGDEPVLLPKAALALALREALTAKLALAGPTRRLVETLAARASDPKERAALGALLAPESKVPFQAWIGAREFIDLLVEFPSARLRPQELVDHMRPLMPRLYSVASSPLVNPDQVDLTVEIVRYESNGRERSGVCTGYLADWVTAGATEIPVFFSHSGFGLPGDGTKDVIMVGPGTGIAPFRAFMQERAASGAKGRNWLFFGNQRRASDFLYEDDWARWTKQGVLTRMDTAFSRDQAEKIYVQDRIRENAADLWSWIRDGAYFYVCGDAKRMAKDVDAALQDLVARHGGLAPSEAAEYVKLMKREKRYQRDVY